MKKQKIALLFFLTLSLTLVAVWPTKNLASESNNGDITFQPNSIPDVNVYYDDYSFVFEYKSYFIRVRPFVIYDGTFYGMKRIVQWIKNNYPNVDYKWLVDKATNAIHYGFNLTKLPQNVADKIDYLGFRLVDLNFPLSWFELETYEQQPENITQVPYNVTIIKIPKANLEFSFEDLYPYGYEIKHINSTYILIGNVKGRTDLFVDPITYSSPTITVTGTYTDLHWELWNASNSNGWNVVHEQGSAHYLINNTQIRIGNDATTTTCSDERVNVLFETTLLYGYIVERYASLTFGKQISGYATSNGLNINFNSSASSFRAFHGGGGTLNLYSSSLKDTYTDNPGDVKYGQIGYFYNYAVTIYNCIFDKFIVATCTNLDIYNLVIFRGLYGLNNPDGTLQQVFLYDCSYLIALASTSKTVKDVNIITTDTVSKIRYTGGGNDHYLINVDWSGANDWGFYWHSAVATSIYRQYDFDLTVTYPNGTAINGTSTGTRVLIQHYGNNSAVDYNATLNGDGTINQTTLSMGFYNQTGGDTIYNYNPFNLQVTNTTGYQDINMNFTLDEQKDWTKALIAESTTASTALLGVAGFAFIMFTVASAIFITRRKKGKGPLKATSP